MEKIKLMKSTFYKEDIIKNRLADFIRRTSKFSMGDRCKEFERRFATYQGREYCALFNSGSSANLALIQSLLNMELIRRRDNAAFSAVTWATNVMPIIELGLKPIPIDVELDTLNVSSDKLLDLAKDHKVSIMFLTNLLGFCDDIDVISSICKDLGILLVEDNCESLGTIYKSKKLGNYGFASTFSFFVGHHMSTIEGGAVCTDNKELYNMLRMVRAHGWDRDLDESKMSDGFYSKYVFYHLGYNLRPTEITGFLGLEQLNHIGEINRKRYDNFKKFYAVSELDGNIETLKHDHISFVSNFAFPVICKSRKLFKEYRDRFDPYVEIRPIVGGNISRQPFLSLYMKDVPLPNADIIHRRGFYFANNPELTLDEIQVILNLL